MGKMTPTSMKRGGHNHVPHPKPTHAPSGHYRCKECNRIVRAGDTCPCQSVTMRDSTLVTRRDDGIKKAYEQAKRERKPEATEKPRKKPREYVFHQKKREPQTDVFACIECGKKFENSSLGRRPLRCHECRKERQREQWRRRNNSAR